MNFELVLEGGENKIKNENNNNHVLTLGLVHFLIQFSIHRIAELQAEHGEMPSDFQFELYKWALECK